MSSPAREVFTRAQAAFAEEQLPKVSLGGQVFAARKALDDGTITTQIIFQASGRHAIGGTVLYNSDGFPVDAISLNRREGSTVREKGPAAQPVANNLARLALPHMLPRTLNDHYPDRILPPIRDSVIR